MATPIISGVSDLAAYFDNVPERTFGRRSSYRLDFDPRLTTGYSAAERRAERLTDMGEPLPVDAFMEMGEWAA